MTHEKQKINYTNRLDSALRRAAWAHEQAGQHRKGTDIPYIIHPFGVMTIASNVTEDEDTLIACLMHDVLEDVDSNIYDADDMRREFGGRVLSIVLDVTKDESITDWHERSKAYLDHLQHQASDEAVIVCAADKMHNLQSMLSDHDTEGEATWERFTTKSSHDQLWWYESVLRVVTSRQAPQPLVDTLQTLTTDLRARLTPTANE